MIPVRSTYSSLYWSLVFFSNDLHLCLYSCVNIWIIPLFRFSLMICYILVTDRVNMREVIYCDIFNYCDDIGHRYIHKVTTMIIFYQLNVYLNAISNEAVLLYILKLNVAGLLHSQTHSNKAITISQSVHIQLQCCMKTIKRVDIVF